MRLSVDVSLLVVAICLTLPCELSGSDRVTVANGILETNNPSHSGIRSFKGIPFAKPPLGDLRWKEPQPVRNWTGVRNADKFGPRCVQQTPPTANFWFRSDGMSEDCLYLNVWALAKSNERLPVLVYIYGGGFEHGDGSEPRYDGENMARHGIIVVTLNYRLDIFGFLSHPELTRESPHHSSGNYGLLDQVAALEWVQKNIAAFGGDPKRVTIGGESAGSIAVSALMASPLSRSLMSAAIGESGAMLGTLGPASLSTAEQDGAKFASSAGAVSLLELRKMTLDQIRNAMLNEPRIAFGPDVDGYFLPKPLTDIYSLGEQAKIPLLAGSNSEERSAGSVLESSELTPRNYAKAVAKLYPDGAGDVLKVYAATSPEEILEAATDLASDRFIAYVTWKWTDLQMKTGGKRVYRYFYVHPRPKFLAASKGPGEAARGGGKLAASHGAPHSAEIQYALGNLALDNRYAWNLADYKVSGAMQAYFVNFVKTGDPNGPELPRWPTYANSDNFQRMRLDVNSRAEIESHLDRYRLMDKLNGNP